MKPEWSRRESLRDRIRAEFLARPLVWIRMADLASIGGLGGWRTRVSELRTIDRLNIEHNGKNGAASMYRLVPHQPLGRDAAEPVSQRGLFS